MKEDPTPLQKLNGPLGTAMSKSEVYHALNDREQVSCVREGMELLRKQAPEEYYKYGDAVERRLVKVLGAPVEKEYDLTEFRGIHEGESAKLDLSKPIVLWGDSGKAKTDFALAQASRPLLIDEPEKLKEINPTFHNLLVFDDMNFGPSGLNFTPEKTIHLLDMKKTRTFKLRYFNGTIPAGMPRIFVTNLTPPEERSATPQLFLHDQFPDDEMCVGPAEEWIFPRSSNEQQNIAIARRYRVAGPVKRMLATPTSSWERFVTGALDKEKKATMDEDKSDVASEVTNATVRSLLDAAKAYRADSGVPLARTGAFW